MDTHRAPAVAALLSVLLLLSAAGRAGAEVTFYVSPADGDDVAADGRSPARGGDASSGPFRTLARARDAVRQFKRQSGGDLREPVTVRLRGGTYTLSEPLVFTAADSGTAAAPVTYAALAGERPVISGGAPVTGWAAREVNGKPAWVTKLPPRDPSASTPWDLWVEGARRTLARHPNEGYFRVVDFDPGHGMQRGHDDFRFAPGDLKAWPSVAEARAVVFNRWSESHMRVTRVDEAAARVYFSLPSLHGLEKDDPYFLQGAADFLDRPGEWYVDRAAGTLTYLPLPGEDPGRVTAVVPNLTRAVVIDGASEPGGAVRYLVFRGLTFAHTGYTLESPGAPTKRSGWTQAAIGVPAVVEAVGLRDAVFEDCTFADAGSYGLLLGRACQDNRVVRCTFTRLGAGGLRIGDTRVPRGGVARAERNEVADCRIFECGLLYPSCVGLWIGQSGDNRVHHNEVFDLPYTGISVGWTWGYGDAAAQGNLIEHNHVHHIGVRSGDRPTLLSDMGGIYTLGNQKGTVIRFNRFHDIAGRNYGGWGIYFDEGTRDILAEKNVVYRTTHGGFHQHYGRDNVVRNNVFAFGKYQQVQRTRAEEHQSFTFDRNVVYWSRGQAVAGNWSTFHAAFDRNVYWRADGKTDVGFGPAAWDAWRKEGLDVHSVWADPQFVDVGNDNFNLKPGSPAIELGFETWDQSDVGPRPPHQ